MTRGIVQTVKVKLRIGSYGRVGRHTTDCQPTVGRLSADSDALADVLADVLADESVGSDSLPLPRR